MTVSAATSGPEQDSAVFVSFRDGKLPLGSISLSAPHPQTAPVTECTDSILTLLVLAVTYIKEAVDFAFRRCS